MTTEDEASTPPADNPAEELHRLFVQWSTRREGMAANTAFSASQFREIKNGRAVGFTEVRRAVRLLDIIEQWLRLAKQQDPLLDRYDSYVAEWEAAVFSYPVGWDSGGGEKPFRSDMIAMLGSLTSLMRLSGLQLDQGTRESMIDLLREVEDQSEDDADLPDDLREFLRTTAAELRRVYADYSRWGTFDFRQSRKALKIALDLAAQRSKTKKAWWAEAGERWTADVSVSAVGGIATQGALLALGMA